MSMLLQIISFMVVTVPLFLMIVGALFVPIIVAGTYLVWWLALIIIFLWFLFYLILSWWHLCALSDLIKKSKSKKL